MDERHHHENDPDGVHASARAARARLDEMQKALPDLQVQRAAVTMEKQEVAEALSKFGPQGDRSASYIAARQAILEEIAKQGPSAERSQRLRDVKDTERQTLVERLTALNLALDDIGRQISAIPPVLAASDRAAHHEDLHRRLR
jgi:hypothetical protein